MIIIRLFWRSKGHLWLFETFWLKHFEAVSKSLYYHWTYRGLCGLWIAKMSLSNDALWTKNQNFVLIWISVKGSKWYNQYRIVYPLIGFEPFRAHVLNILCSKLCSLVDTLSSRSMMGTMVLQRGLHGTERLLHNALGRRQERDLNL